MDELNEWNEMNKMGKSEKYANLVWFIDSFIIIITTTTILASSPVWFVDLSVTSVSLFRFIENNNPYIKTRHRNIHSNHPWIHSLIHLTSYFIVSSIFSNPIWHFTIFYCFLVPIFVSCLLFSWCCCCVQTVGWIWLFQNIFVWYLPGIHSKIIPNIHWNNRLASWFSVQLFFLDVNGWKLYLPND